MKKSKTATIVKPKIEAGVRGWLEANGVKPKDGKVILFKRISGEWKTQENTENETKWGIGTSLTHPDWLPESGECGRGKFHACSRPYFCDEFRSTKGDRYIAVEIPAKETYAWPNPYYPHKIGFRVGKVLYECDRIGRKLGQGKEG